MSASDDPDGASAICSAKKKSTFILPMLQTDHTAGIGNLGF